MWMLVFFFVFSFVVGVRSEMKTGFLCDTFGFSSLYRVDSG